MSNYIEQYRGLRENIDRLAGDIQKAHGENIVCRKGCCGCCVNLTVFPVEFYAILDDLKKAGVEGIEFDESASCGFLKDGACQIYAYRPMICRTHGLPIVFYNEEVEPAEFSVSFCDMNFADADFDEIEFTPDNSLSIDELNEELAGINIDYIRENSESGWEMNSRIELKKLIALL